MDVFAGTRFQNAIFTCISLRKRLHNDGKLTIWPLKTTLTIPISNTFPLHDKKYFGKCDFCDWLGGRPGKGEGWAFRVTQEICACNAQVCGCVHMGSAGEEIWKKMFANHCRQELNERLRVYNIYKTYLISMEYPGVRVSGNYSCHLKHSLEEKKLMVAFTKLKP